MRILPNPNRCIWCRRTTPEIRFDESHVLPRCLGNDVQHTLPPGIVCQRCNNYFGTQVEPILLDDPLLHVRAVTLRIVDPRDAHAFRDQFFDAHHPSTEPVSRNLNLAIQVQDSELRVGITYTIQGTLSRTYSNRQLRLLSRAIHKIAFEWLAWDTYVRGVDDPVDLLDPTFDAIRRWGREGQPMNRVRPVARRLSETISANWGIRIWRAGIEMVAEMDLFGDWYGVSLTSAPETGLVELRRWVGENRNDVWCLGERLFLLNETE